MSVGPDWPSRAEELRADGRLAKVVWTAYGRLEAGAALKARGWATEESPEAGA